MLCHVPAQPLPDVDVVRIVEAGGHDPQDRIGRVIEAELLADDGRVGAVARAPQPVADDRNELVIDKKRAADWQTSADLRADSKKIEEVAADLYRI